MLIHKATHVIPALQSRCTKFKFSSINAQEAFQKVQTICTNENLDLNPNVIEEIIQVSKGDMRKCINILQSVFLAVSWNLLDSAPNNKDLGGQTTPKSIKTLSVDQFYRIIGSISPNDTERIYKVLLSETFTPARIRLLIRR